MASFGPNCVTDSSRAHGGSDIDPTWTSWELPSMTTCNCEHIRNEGRKLLIRWDSCWPSDGYNPLTHLWPKTWWIQAYSRLPLNDGLIWHLYAQFALKSSLTPLANHAVSNHVFIPFSWQYGSWTHSSCWCALVVGWDEGEACGIWLYGYLN